MPPAKNVDVDVNDNPGYAYPKVVVRGAPPPPPQTPAAHPVLYAANGDSVTFYNNLTQDITISIPWAKHALTPATSTFGVNAGQASAPFTVKQNVDPKYKKALRYFVLAETSGEYGESNSDPLIEIK